MPRKFDPPPGTPIPGSRLVRAYCVRCGEPIRVNDGDQWNGIECEECDPIPPGPKGDCLTERQRYGLGKTGG